MNKQKMKSATMDNLHCPLPINEYPQVLLAHGGGGRVMHRLIQEMFVHSFGAETLQSAHDAALLDINTSKIAFTTDSYVVKPLFFPGGNIGSLAINGTVNDLAMVGARPLYTSLGLILEEGLDMNSLWTVVQSIKTAADLAGTKVVTGDTKVVDNGKGDGIYINTSGVGVIEHGLSISPKTIQVGDQIILNGDLARHGISIMAVREGLEFESTIKSDSAPLYTVVNHLLQQGIEIRCMRDLTRGGLASATNEIAETSGLKMVLSESDIPVQDDVRGACEMLGFDPLYVANEGRFILFVPEQDSEQALKIIRKDGEFDQACIIGEVTEALEPIVELNSAIGTSRILDMLSGEQLPRIC